MILSKNTFVTRLRRRAGKLFSSDLVLAITIDENNVTNDLREVNLFISIRINSILTLTEIIPERCLIDYIDLSLNQSSDGWSSYRAQHLIRLLMLSLLHFRILWPSMQWVRDASGMMTTLDKMFILRNLENLAATTFPEQCTELCCVLLGMHWSGETFKIFISAILMSLVAHKAINQCNIGFLPFYVCSAFPSSSRFIFSPISWYTMTLS